MKLVPRAKPVKIRILSGGGEHSSLESLRKGFVWSDVRKLIPDGRLETWLRKLGEDKVADRLHNTGVEVENPLEIYNLLFRKDNNHFKDSNQVYKECVNDISLKGLVSALLVRENIIDMKKIHVEVPQMIRILEKHISESTSSVTPEEYLSLGQYHQVAGNEKKAQDLIKKSMSLGNDKAKGIFVLSLVNSLKNPSKSYNCTGVKNAFLEMESKIKYSFPRGIWLNFTPKNAYEKSIKELYDCFLNLVKTIHRDGDFYYRSNYCVSRNAKKLIEVKRSDILFPIKALFFVMLLRDEDLKKESKKYDSVYLIHRLRSDLRVQIGDFVVAWNSPYSNFQTLENKFTYLLGYLINHAKSQK